MENFNKKNEDEQPEFDFDFLEFSKTLEYLNNKYPYARPFVENDGKGGFLVGENRKPMSKEELTDYYETLNNTYMPEENDKWQDK